MRNKILMLCLFCVTAITGQNNLPKVFTLDPQKIYALRNSFLKGDLKENPAVKKLINNADSFLDMDPVSIMQKDQIPPSGDKHDYMSMGKYWWPNPDKKDGLPYIRKDGEVNPEALKISDAANGKNMISAVVALSLAYYITNDSKYSSRVSSLLRVWFIDEKSKMNPNLNYAQFIPGVNEGRGAGIIDLHTFYQLVDAISLLENSKEWSNEDDTKIKKWFEDYLNWLRTSKNGIAESNTKNNHGTWYDVQIVSVSLFLGKLDFAKQFLHDALIKRITTQIKKDGSQPFELVRTKSWHYSAFNIEALSRLAIIGDNIGINLWNYTNEEGGSIRKAIDYILPGTLDAGQWKHPQISKIEKDEIYPLLILAKKKFDKQVYSEWIEKIFGKKLKSGIENIL